MTQQNLQTLKGFRDFLPEEKKVRDFVASKLIQTFKLFGFEPLETPTLEYASLLLNKYGQEADKLVYKFEDRGGREVALKYDQTVPTARVLAQYQNDLPKFFRRYQIQNVFRADKPQKGRFREFTQCDIDVFGSTGIIGIADAEILACTYFALKNIGINNLIIKLNDRQLLLQTLQNFASDEVNVYSIIQSIDKLDKISPAEVIEELKRKGLTQEKAEQILQALVNVQISGQLQNIINLAQNLGVKEDSLQFVPSLARGLDYYTGMIFEIIIPEYTAGSIGGGGRYDNLINQLSGVDIPAVGMAFGFDRLVEVVKQFNLFTQKENQTVLMTIFTEDLKVATLKLAAELRQKGINIEVYPAIDNLSKQFKCASKKGIKNVLVMGQDEVEQNKITVKNMETGQQQTLTMKEIVNYLA
ncbi:histidine--tRNA ligase [Candidatus Beckwithbacteria bacterium]|nr:histidine--tRNA ligase [Candidatus Beckwithbacteria bacterium]